MSSRGFRLAALPVLVSLALAGCSLAPKYERPAMPVPGQYPDRDAVSNTGPRSASAVSPQVGNRSDLGWSEFFTDARLKALISEALANNTDMRICVGREVGRSWCREGGG